MPKTPWVLITPDLPQDGPAYLPGWACRAAPAASRLSSMMRSRCLSPIPRKIAAAPWQAVMASSNRRRWRRARPGY
jgi:hypothetical protein